MNLNDLKKKFPAEDIEWRIGRVWKDREGKVWAVALAYVTARAVHDRLDEVCQPENWSVEYKEHKVSYVDKKTKETKIVNGTIAIVGIQITEKKTVYKQGGSDASDIEAFKGCLSGAEKRAGVPWGIGRYLYKLKETFVKTSMTKIKDWNYGSGYDKKKKEYFDFYWETPTLPSWALPENEPIKVKAKVSGEKMSGVGHEFGEEPPDEVYDESDGYEEEMGITEEGPGEDYDPYEDDLDSQMDEAKDMSLEAQQQRFEAKLDAEFPEEMDKIGWLESMTQRGIRDKSGIEDDKALMWMVRMLNDHPTLGDKYLTMNDGKKMSINKAKTKDFSHRVNIFNKAIKEICGGDEVEIEKAYWELTGKGGLTKVSQVKTEAHLNTLKGKLETYQRNKKKGEKNE